MWRGDEHTPFHTEVGYWLWDANSGEIVRGFVVPRGITVLAGGHSPADAIRFTLRATKDDPDYTLGENRYLAKNASSLSYEVMIEIADEDEWSYDETTMLQMKEFEGAFAHTDHNTLRRTA